MPDLNMTAGISVDLSLYLVTAMDYATITSSSATQFVMTEGARTFTLTGTGFSFTNIGGFQYINGGTVDAITVDEGAGNLCSFTGLALAGATLRNATRADREGTNNAALENLFRGLTYTINGTVGVDSHGTGTSVEALSLALTRGNTYNLSGGDDVVLSAGSGGDTIIGLDGFDSLMGNGGNDSIDGGADNDTIYGGSGNDTLDGGNGTDSVYGDDGDDSLVLFRTGQLFGGTGNDTLLGSYFVSSVQYGGDGNDVLESRREVQSFDPNGDRLFGGSGNDNLFVSGPNPVQIEMHGDDGLDTLTGSTAADTLYGGDGNDSLTGGGGNDGLSGDAGNDVLVLGTAQDLGFGFAYGGAGNDTITATGSGNSLFGDAGADSITGSDFADFIYGGLGNDRAFGGIDIDRLEGGAGNDSLDGGTGGDSVFGGEGNDTLLGGADDDNLDGSEGNDVLIGGAGGDTMDGGEGIDLASYAASGAGVTVSLLGGPGIGGDAAGDVLTGIENVIGSGLNDDLTGDGNANLLSGGIGIDALYGLGGSDTLDGGSGNDVLVGGSGADSLLGGIGNDTINGGSGADTIVGGAQIDVMTGDSGSDVFLFLAFTDTGNAGPRDSITDFVSGEDQVSFAGLGLTLVTGAFTGANQIRWDAALSRLQINLDAVLSPDRQIDLTGVGLNFDAATDLILV